MVPHAATIDLTEVASEPISRGALHDGFSSPIICWRRPRLLRTRVEEFQFPFGRKSQVRHSASVDCGLCAIRASRLGGFLSKLASLIATGEVVGGVEPTASLILLFCSLPGLFL
ncbi:hypothetical protein CRG98_038844 [Punica granatum]|uniref:Uncharacterized protein n=1 Tax=Punica granatum TaxID=22663 RepID=A0A2I0IAN4_PUNGR|nr:hypothetical protein CRG98_038844 [Punica granatum]